MDWNWRSIPAEYLIANVRVCRGGKLAKRRGFLHVKKGKVETVGVGEPAMEGFPAFDAGGWV